MNLTPPSQFKKGLISLYHMFNMSLDEMSQSYPSYKLGTDKITFPKDKQQFNNIRGNIFKQQQNLFSSASSVEQQTQELNDMITNINKENKILTNRVNNFGSVGLAAKGELKLQKVLYNELYARNVLLIMLILLYIGIFFKKRN